MEGGDQLSSQTQQKVDEIRKLFYGDCAHLAYERILDLDKYLNEKLDDEEIDDSERRQARIELKIISEDKILSLIKEEVKIAEQCLEEISTYEGWSVGSESPSCKTYYRDEPGMVATSLRLEGPIDHDLFRPLPIFMETDLYPEWLPFCREGKLLHEVSPYRRVIKIGMKLPFPFALREALVCGTGWPLKDRKAALIVLKGLKPGDFLGFQVPEIDRRAVELEVFKGIVLLDWVSEKKCYFKAIFNVDPKIPVVPQWLQGLVLRQIMPQILRIIRNKCDDYDTGVYKQRVLEKAEWYDGLRQRINGMFQDEAEDSHANEQSRERNEAKSSVDSDEGSDDDDDEFVDASEGPEQDLIVSTST